MYPPSWYNKAIPSFYEIAMMIDEENSSFATLIQNKATIIIDKTNFEF